MNFRGLIGESLAENIWWIAFLILALAAIGYFVVNKLL